MSAACSRLLTPERLGSFPAPLQRRAEIMAFTYAALRDHRSLDVLDRGLLRAYREAYLTALAWNLCRLLTLDEILAETRIRGLRLIVVKGGLLSRTHYGDPGARPMADLDAICDPGELRGLIEVAQKLGFRTYPHSSWRIARNATHDVQLSNGSVVLELHYRLWHELRIDSSVQGLVSRATEIPFGAGWVHAPDRADHLYLVLVHAALHGFTGNPLWLIDDLWLLGGQEAGRGWHNEEQSPGRATCACARAQEHPNAESRELFATQDSETTRP